MTLAVLITKRDIMQRIKNSIDTVNRELVDYERIKKFQLLPREFSLEEGELTPTLKMKRNVILFRYKDIIKRLYGRE